MQAKELTCPTHRDDHGLERLQRGVMCGRVGVMREAIWQSKRFTATQAYLVETCSLSLCYSSSAAVQFLFSCTVPFSTPQTPACAIDEVIVNKCYPNGTKAVVASHVSCPMLCG
jgi:hypothetical protein